MPKTLLLFAILILTACPMFARDGGTQTATAHIETREHCDDGVISTESVVVPPNSVIQV